LLVLLPFMMLKPEESVDYRVARAFMLQRAHEMACKIVKWVDLSYRLIIGEIFSGLFLTSWLDTVYMILAVSCCLILCYERVRKVDENMAIEFQNSFIRRAQYGDDSCYAFEHRFVDVLFKNRDETYVLGDFQRDMECQVGLKCKSAQTKLFEPYGGDSPLFTVLKPTKVNGKVVSHEIIRDGPEFLHRRFVKIQYKGKVEIMPWRHENDFYSRVAISSTQMVYNNKKFSAKLMGLMVDTMGTNAVAYNALSYLFRTTSGISDFGDIPLLDWVSTNKELMRAIVKTGMLVQDLDRIFKIGDLFDMFVWDEEWRRVWADNHGLALYDRLGCERGREVESVN